ncbi:MAG: 50S ribosomal protein L18 [Armatimonadota bacterium]|nr:50S ribosomal protein L18 [Armatimonadota bacterium]MDR7427942.1 50S ribosomal protein L18 [Armatimonadota bacterium]MDR7465625.1 50S ribosomal protein L18 [Armatimonadota bacterium]MDR7473498.1 50S ribosomal protein L18 [Armatimonadota bacterium]MDR7540145.1 50S ribosomal protein L18 [Armatimonadota bacterium]
MLRRTDRNLLRKRRHLRVRQRVSGTVTRPRLVVFRSLGHIYAQVVDDGQGHTLAAASTLDPELREQVKGKRKVEASRVVGELIARRARERGITRVVFDRAGYAYHGRVKALAEGARAGGLEF